MGPKKAASKTGGKKGASKPGGKGGGAPKKAASKTGKGGGSKPKTAAKGGASKTNVKGGASKQKVGKVGSKVKPGKVKGGKKPGADKGKSPKAEASTSNTAVKNEVSETSTAAPKIEATPEVIAKNKELLDKIVALMGAIKADGITRSNKDDLDTVQLLIKNISHRDGGEPSKVREVVLTDMQKAIIKQVNGEVSFDEADPLAMTVTDGTKGKSINAPTAGGTVKINFPYAKLDFAPTK